MMMKRTVTTVLALALALPLFATKPSKQAEQLMKKASEGSQFIAEHLWYGRLCVLYKHAGGIGAVLAPKKKEEVARVEASLYDGVFYIALRDKEQYRMVAFERGRLSRVTEVSRTQCFQAGGYISPEVREELEKAYRTKHRVYAREFVLPDKNEFRVFIFH